MSVSTASAGSYMVNLHGASDYCAPPATSKKPTMAGPSVSPKRRRRQRDCTLPRVQQQRLLGRPYPVQRRVEQRQPTAVEYPSGRHRAMLKPELEKACGGEGSLPLGYYYYYYYYKYSYYS